MYLDIAKVDLGMCAQRRLRSVCVSAQSDKSLLGALWVAKVPMILHMESEDFDLCGCTG